MRSALPWPCRLTCSILLYYSTFLPYGFSKACYRNCFGEVDGIGGTGAVYLHNNTPALSTRCSKDLSVYEETIISKLSLWLLLQEVTGVYSLCFRGLEERTISRELVVVPTPPNTAGSVQHNGFRLCNRAATNWYYPDAAMLRKMPHECNHGLGRVLPCGWSMTPACRGQRNAGGGWVSPNTLVEDYSKLYFLHLVVGLMQVIMSQVKERPRKDGLMQHMQCA